MVVEDVLDEGNRVLKPKLLGEGHKIWLKV